MSDESIMKSFSMKPEHDHDLLTTLNTALTDTKILTITNIAKRKYRLLATTWPVPLRSVTVPLTSGTCTLLKYKNKANDKQLVINEPSNAMLLQKTKQNCLFHHQLNVSLNVYR
ncbi:hypothetical protein GQX74_004232 [Glossina fuscipes]|nr:hypothetical protein GQX74_004232 [Glossina fuscipes]